MNIAYAQVNLKLFVFNSCLNGRLVKIGDSIKWYGSFSIRYIYIYNICYICADFTYFLLFLLEHKGDLQSHVDEQSIMPINLFN